MIPESRSPRCCARREGCPERWTSRSPVRITASSAAWSRTTSAGLRLADAMDDDVLLVDEMNGAPLPPQHGAPVRLVAPGWYGMAQVKWLHRITVLDRPFEPIDKTPPPTG